MNKYLDKYYYLHLWDKLLKRPQADNGFIPYEPYGKDELHFLGKNNVLGQAKTVLRSNRDYRPFRPIGEKQKRNGNETFSCVSQSAANVLEEIILCINELLEIGKANAEQEEIVKVFKHFGILRKKDNKWNANISDRYIAKLSNTTRRGNTQKAVADAIRHYGLVPEEDWPWVDSWDNYYSPVSGSIIDKGKAILDYIEITYEWANPSLVDDSLKYAPLQTSVYAWTFPNKDGKYYRVQHQKNHATTRDASDKNSFYIFDSYEPFAKKATKDFNFGWDMIFTIHLKKKLEIYNRQEIEKLLGRGFKFIMRTEKEKGGKGQVYKLDENGVTELDANDKITEAVKELAKRKDLTGISEADFANLFI